MHLKCMNELQWQQYSLLVLLLNETLVSETQAIEHLRALFAYVCLVWIQTLTEFRETQQNHAAVF